MIRLFMKKSLYSYERIIFPDSLVDSKADIVRYMRFYEKPTIIENVNWDNYVTPITYLSDTVDDIRKKYSKDVRYEVRRAGREKIIYSIFDHTNLKSDDPLIQDVIQKYFDFCDQIGRPSMKDNLQPEEFSKMVDNGNIVISKADFENGWTYHVYQVDGRYTMLWFSFSDYRKEGANKSLSGWANRGLHDFDIMFFKDKGYIVYDWGNISSIDNPNHIDKFKMSFGGELTTVFCCFYGNTIKGKTLIKLREIKNTGNE